MESTERDETPEPVAPEPQRRRGRIFLIAVAVIALLAVTATAVTAATTGWRFTRPGDSANAMPEWQQAQAGPGGPNGQQRGFPGLQGIVTAVDTNAKTITLAGVPGVTTVTVDANVKLTMLKTDGTTDAATLTDFKAGQVVRVHGKPDRGQTPSGQRPNPANFKLTVSEITLAPAGMVRGFGLVTATSGNTITVVGMGGLSLMVTPASGATLKKMDDSAFVIGDVKVGDHLMFSGQQNGNAISATDLRLIPQGSFGKGGFGPGGPGGQGGWHPGGSRPPGAPGGPPSA
ncbi:MAG: hypothetical protein M3176_15010 [Chloroflexota bacterium]|nr:hypothetical protein [Chloroflexota bacterium]